MKWGVRNEERLSSKSGASSKTVKSPSSNVASRQKTIGQKKLATSSDIQQILATSYVRQARAQERRQKIAGAMFVTAFLARMVVYVSYL